MAIAVSVAGGRVAGDHLQMPLAVSAAGGEVVSSDCLQAPPAASSVLFTGWCIANFRGCMCAHVHPLCQWFNLRQLS